jgi:hypothetical protein
LFSSRVEEGFLITTEEQLPPYERESLFFFDPSSTTEEQLPPYERESLFFFDGLQAMPCRCLYRLGALYYHNKPEENPQLISLFIP